MSHTSYFKPDQNDPEKTVKVADVEHEGKIAPTLEQAKAMPQREVDNELGQGESTAN